MNNKEFIMELKDKACSHLSEAIFLLNKMLDDDNIIVDHRNFIRLKKNDIKELRTKLKDKGITYLTRDNRRKYRHRMYDVKL